MAVILQYLVVRNGIEKMSFTNKKEADAYDKLLDLAEHLDTVLIDAPVSLNEADREALALYLAEHQAKLSLPRKTAAKKSAPQPSREALPVFSANDASAADEPRASAGH